MDNTNNTSSGALFAIDELRIDSKIGKSKHFNASERKMFWHRIYGVPVILANLFVGIVLVSLQGTNVAVAPVPEASATADISENKKSAIVGQVSSKENLSSANRSVESQRKSDPLIASSKNDFLSLLSIFLAFAAASLSAIQTFFNFHKASEGHRSIGNRYVHISRQCKGLQQKNRDVPFSAADLWFEYEKLYADYHQINMEAEAFPTNASDLAKAKIAPEISRYTAPGASS